ASMFNTPIVPVREPECGLLGGAAIVRHGLGDFATLEEAALATAQYGPPVEPAPDLVARYNELFPIFRAAKQALGPVNRALGKNAGALDDQ
ncbi:MAG: hypothetical protein AAGB11_08365, partial [Pseudomonadota bacterium]